MKYARIARRLGLIAAGAVSLVTFGWLIRPDTKAPRMEPAVMSTPVIIVKTPPPKVIIKTPPPRIITKTLIQIKKVNVYRRILVPVPGPVRIIIKYVSRAKVRPALPLYISPGGVAACIRKWESGNNYRAQNPNSTASGAYQFLDTTWQAITGLPGRAMNYPPATQDKAFYRLWNGGAGRSQWVMGYKC